MRIYRHPSPIGALRLDGLLDEPDPGAVARMEAFDELPTSLRRRLDDCDFDFNPLVVAEAVGIDGPSRTLAKVEHSVHINRRQFIQERQRALEWARDKFRIGPRPKGEPPPGGWTVHNFPG